MGKGFGKGVAALAFSDGLGKEASGEVMASARMLHEVGQGSEAERVVRAQFLYPDAKAMERQAMRRQHQSVRRQMAEPIEGIQILGQGIGLGLVREDTDHRRDLGENLIAGNKNFFIGAPEGGMRRRMATADHNLPLAAAEAHDLAVAQRTISSGNGPHEGAGADLLVVE